MDDIPIIIQDDENIVRGITSYHLNKGRLIHQAFKPPGGRDDVSVIRSDYIGKDACKVRAKAVEDLGLKRPKRYEGLAVLQAAVINNTGARVEDSRSEYLGHADIRHGFVVTEGEPNSPELTMQMVERNKTLASAANYHPDQHPEVEEWRGPELVFTHK